MNAFVSITLAATIAGAPTAHVTMQSSHVYRLGNGAATAWVETADGVPVRAGVTLGAGSLQNLSPDESELVIPMPPAPGLPIESAVVDWHPHGHPPAHVYDVPHFDVHFYTIGERERATIGPATPVAAIRPSPPLVPPGFVTDGSVVPAMGMHYVAAAAPEFNGGKFAVTPIYGYYGGHMDFLEVMASVAFMKSEAVVDAPFPQPPSVERHGYYPRRYALHCAPSGACTVTLSQFVRR